MKIWFVEKKSDIFVLFVKNLVTKEGSYVSELAQYYRIEKIHKHFGDVRKTGHKGTDPKDFSPAIGKVDFLKKKEKEILKRMKIRRNVILNKTSTKKE